jgi:two-component system, chemotaxis family, protein-glutamate methylesterase/glutaminase
MVSGAIIVVGASAGGLVPLQTFVRGLDRDLAASIFVVMHVPPSSPSVLPQLLTRAGPLPAVHPADGSPIERGHIYIAPPDHHLVLERDRMRTVQGPRENSSRPAIDPLFRTAAEVFGPSVIGIILSGARSDGALGLAAVKDRGGKALVQSPEDALYRGMPDASLESTAPDFVGTPEEIARVVCAIVAGTASAAPRVTPSRPAPGKAFDSSLIDPETAVGIPSPFSCPDCHGVLWSMPGKMPRFRCRTGHDYSGDALLRAQSYEQERTLWAALRSAQEWAETARRLEADARQRGHGHSASDFAESAGRAEKRIRALEATLGRVEGAPVPVEVEGGLAKDEQ